MRLTVSQSPTAEEKLYELVVADGLFDVDGCLNVRELDLLIGVVRNREELA